MELITDKALKTRRIIAANLKLETITALRSRPDPHNPDLDLMQALYDSGFKQCPASGMPVFDPSKCSATMKESLWRAYCGIALAIDDTSKAAEAAATLDELKLEIERLGVPPTPPPSPPGSDDEDDVGGGGMIGMVFSFELLKMPNDVLELILTGPFYFRNTVALLFSCRQLTAFLPTFKQRIDGHAAKIQVHWRRCVVLLRSISATWQTLRDEEDDRVSRSELTIFEHASGWCFDEWAARDDGECKREQFELLLEGDDGGVNMNGGWVNYRSTLSPAQLEQRSALTLMLLPAWPERLESLTPLRKFALLVQVPAWMFDDYYMYY